MPDRRCPKCGSDQILNDECLKCGLILSKFTPSLKVPSQPQSPVSFVSPASSPNVDASPSFPETPTWTTQGVQPAVSVLQLQKKANLQVKIAWAVLIVVLSSIGYLGYKVIRRKVAAFGGYYKNERVLFAIQLPAEGWYHYYKGEREALEFKNAADAFYRGSDPDDPEIILVVWTDNMSRPIPDRFNEGTKKKLLDALEDEIVDRMEGSGFECELTESRPGRPGGNDGFEFRADLTKEDLRMKTIIVCAFRNYTGYTFQFLGKDTDMLQREEEIREIVRSISFKMSII